MSLRASALLALGTLGASVCAAPMVAQAPALRWTGMLVQGGLIQGTAPPGTATLTLDGVAVPIAADGRFVIGFDRDAGAGAVLTATLGDGRTVSQPLAIAARAWNVSRLDTLAKIPLPEPEFDSLRPAELTQIAAARATPTDAAGWRQPMRWPVTGRISTLFGSQRIYKDGAAGAYHSGIDIARATGTAVTAPADGVVILAADHPFTLEGNLLMIDHGMGLTARSSISRGSTFTSATMSARASRSASSACPVAPPARTCTGASAGATRSSTRCWRRDRCPSPHMRCIRNSIDRWPYLG